MRLFLNTLFKDKLRSYQILSLLLAIVSIMALGVAIFFAYQSQKQRENSTIENISPPTKNIPMYDQIMSIVEPLQYSGLQALLRDDVSLQIDFDKPAWHLKNIHRFDHEGNILLDENRYGLCGELASYTYTKIAPLLSPLYNIQFSQVAESGFFLQPKASHIILLIQDKSDPSKIFLLDPSLANYGLIDNFDNYLFYGNRDNLEFVKEQEKDVTFPVDGGTPIFIQNNDILLLTVEAPEGKFDKENFAIAITATQRFKYSGRYVLIVRKTQGKIEFFENPYLAKQLFSPENYQALKNKILFWIENQN